MKRAIHGLCFSLFVLLANPWCAFSTNSNLLNRIEGQVYDPNHRPVQNLYVELLNEVDSVIQRTKTDGSGRFSFAAVPPGRLMVRVLTFGTNYMEQTQEVEVLKTRNNNDVEYLDFTLRYNSRNRGPATEMPPGVIFAQDIPPTAKALYLKAVADFGNDQNRGLEEIEEALKIFPNYF